MFCVECGKEGMTYGGLCGECYLSRKRPVTLPPVLDVQICGACFAVHIGKSWIDSLSIDEAVRLSLDASLKKEKNVSDVKLETKLVERDPRNYLADVRISFRIEDLEGAIDKRIEIRLKKDTCTRCGKKSGHYYEAIIQLRGHEKDKKRIERARKEILSRIDAIGSSNREIFISKEERKHGGYDFFLSSSQTAKSVSREMMKAFGATMKSSPAVGGRKDGHDLVRMTYLVRLPDYDEGDVVTFGGRAYLVRSIEAKSVNLFDLSIWQETKVPKSRIRASEVLHREESVHSTSVIVEADDTIQIIDPSSMKPVEVKKPDNFRLEGSTVSIIRTKLGTFLLP
ncbi:MAG: NMD3-related protein [Thermoplasmata archaeon]|nr:NMD3-related protein [Thermoplasmata archaeon]